MLQIWGCLLQNGLKTDTFVFQENRMILLIHFYIVEARVGFDDMRKSLNIGILLCQTLNIAALHHV